eukprot:736196-Prymnesium_polylepis.1
MSLTKVLPDLPATPRDSVRKQEQERSPSHSDRDVRWKSRAGLMFLGVLGLPVYDGMVSVSAYAGLLATAAAFGQLGWYAVIVWLFLAQLIEIALLAFIAIAVKWLVVGRLHEQARFLFLRWRCGRLIHAFLVPVFQIIRSTYLMNLLLSALGAKVSGHAVIETVQVADWDMVQLGNNTILEEEASVSCAHLHPDGIAIQPVAIDALVGARAHVPAGSTVRRSVAPFQASTKAHASRSPNDQRISITSCPLGVWLLAFMHYSVLVSFAQSVPVVMAVCAFLGTGMPFVFTDAGHLDCKATIVSMYEDAEPWKPFFVLFVNSFSMAVLMPLTFVATAAAARS